MREEAMISTTETSWWMQLVQFKVGTIPVVLYAVLAAVIFAAALYGKLPADMIGGIAVMMIMGVLLGDIGLRAPILKDIGGPAILSIFIPSVLVFYNLIHPSAIKAITAFMKGSNFLYLYIACLVTGSILGMKRMVLIQGFIRMFVPLAVGTLGSIVGGVAVGTLTGLGVEQSLFYVVIPILSGGVGEGILPLSMAYSEILQQPYEKILPQLVPAAMLGNLVAIMTAGYLRRLAVAKPHLSGNGTLVKSGDGELKKKMEAQEERSVDFSLMGAGLLLACTLYIWGLVASPFLGIPAPIIMIFSAALIKAAGIMPGKMEQGAFHMYRFVATSLTWALLVGVGVLYTPWQEVVAAITPAYILTVMATVLGMIGSGFFIARYVNMYPVESAVVTACHSGLGGTGDVAILSSANRMELMPFAQVSTRLGGACVVVLAAILLRIWL
jgi:malate:Na+ symporter